LNRVFNSFLNEVLAALFAVGFATACACATARAMEQQPTHDCGGGEIARGTVRSIVDGRTFVLEDGREVRLAAIEVPPLEAPQNAGQAVPDGKATAAALNALAGGDQVILRGAEIAADRYGRLIAYAYAMRDGDALFVQGELVGDGFARVDDRVGRDCAGELLSCPKGKAWPLGRSVL
jgi:endonuclease YncB( thermonuclease family)